MSGSGPPTNIVVANGTGVFGDSQMNTFVQLDPNVAALRQFTGLQYMAVFLEGYVTPGDGGAGMFFWNNGNAYTDDGGITTVVPYGVTTGAWLRNSLLVTPTTSFTSINVTGTASFGGVVNMAGGLGVTGAGSFGGTLSVTNAAQFLSAIEVTGAGSIGGTFTVTGNTELAANVVVEGSVEIAGLLAVGLGSSGFAGSVAIGQNFLVEGSSVLEGAVAFGSAGGPTITTGTGAPSSTEPKGSIYLRQDGSTGSTLYVTQGSATWNAVSGV